MKASKSKPFLKYVLPAGLLLLALYWVPIRPSYRGLYYLIVTLGVISFPFVLLWGEENSCVECEKWFKRKTTSDKKVAKSTDRSMLHGRVTKSGHYDRRYNTVIGVTERGTRYRKFKCAACGHTWELDEPYEDSHNESA